jgi:predicted nucleotidyltransferase
MNLEEIKRKIDEYKPFLKKEFKVKSISVFGSYLRGEQTKKSDIDTLKPLIKNKILKEAVSVLRETTDFICTA